MTGPLEIPVDPRGVTEGALRALDLVAREFPGRDPLTVVFQGPGRRESRLTLGRRVDAESVELQAAAARIVRTYQRPPPAP